MIWVVLSQPVSVKKAQEVILNKLQVPHHEWKNRTVDEKSKKICNILKQKGLCYF